MLALLALALMSPSAFGQGSSATLGGTVQDASSGVLPGASITAINVNTGVETKTTANNSGIYNFPSLQPGTYNITAEAPGFQKAVKTDVRLGVSAQARLNFDMAVAGSSETVEVTATAENMVLDAGSSTGTVLQEEMVNEIPLLSNNVMDLINMMGGVVAGDDPIFGGGNQTFAGVTAGNINVQRDGMSVSEVRWGAGVTSSTNMNTEMVGEFKMILSPVDAEMGRGAGQVQMTTKSGSNAYHGSAVWNIQNTALDAREWLAKKNNLEPTWRNLNNYMLTASGPIIKNKTFFFATWDHQIFLEKRPTITKVLTPCARKGIYRYLSGWNPDNSGATADFTSYTRPSVDENGTPLAGTVSVWNPSANNYQNVTSSLKYMSVFGDLTGTPAEAALLAAGTGPTGLYGDCSAMDAYFDPMSGRFGVQGEGAGSNPYTASSYWGGNFSTGGAYRYAFDPTGYVNRFTYGTSYSGGTVVMPPANYYAFGDGLNYAGHKWNMVFHGDGSIYGTGGDPSRKSITAKIDHQINNEHRISGTYTWEKYYVEDNYAQWPKEYGGYGGGIDRKPQNLIISLTSTLRPTLLNEFRFGLSRSDTMTNTAFSGKDGNDVKDLLSKLLPTDSSTSFAGTPFQDQYMLLSTGTAPLLFSTDAAQDAYYSTGSNTASHPFGSRGNIPTGWGGLDPRWTFNDTVTWMKGAHSFKGGVEVRIQSSRQDYMGNRDFGGNGAFVALPVVVGGTTSAMTSRRAGALSTVMPAADVAPNSHDTAMATDGNYKTAYALMTYFSGSLNRIRQYFYATGPNQWNDAYTKGEDIYSYQMNNREFSAFFKDDWKLTNDLTLNLGVRYEYYGVPYVPGGKTLGLPDGGMSIFGITQGGWKNWMTGRQYVTGDPTTLYQTAFEYVDSAWNKDLNNFAPHVGFAWQLPWLGRGKTTLRGGYSISYTPVNNFDQYGIWIAANGGANTDYVEVYTGTSAGFTPAIGDTNYYMDLTDLSTVDSTGRRILPMQVTGGISALSPKKVGQFSGYPVAVDENVRNPYIQSINLSLTRNFGNALTVDVRYIGTLSRKAIATDNINQPNYISNGLYAALEDVRQGHSNPLINSLITVGSLGAAGSVDGSDELRKSFFTATSLARGDFNTVANTLTSTNGYLFDPTDPSAQGLVLRNGCLPEDRVGGVCTKSTPWNYITANPQFSNYYAQLVHNAVKTNYHSMQAQVTLRPTRGLNFQATYTWSRNLGDSAWTNLLGARDYQLSAQHRSHTLNTYGSYELPFGANGFIFRNSSGWFKKAVEGWSLSWVGSVSSGQPYSLTGSNTLWSNSYPVLERPDLFDSKDGHVTWDNEGNAGYYFGQKYTNYALDTRICDASRMDATLYSSYCTLTTGGPRVLALASGVRDANGNMLPAVYQNGEGAPYGRADGEPIVVFRNADQRLGADAMGNYKGYQLTGPGRWSLDMAMSKSIEFMEGKKFEIRVDAQNVFNHPMPSNATSISATANRFTAISNPTGTINSGTFGYLASKGGHRTFQAKLRLSF
ncbi:MAG: carboxypeptidase-like regulatory domain-containing protein [Acidobacteriota bacterium]|nr:carboxypeptidase-like regulatory domain-containing protein [Acidobacteriota bacterium]